MLYAIVALLVIILDQWTKFWVTNNIAYQTGSRELIPGLLKLVNIHNDGAALGFLSGKNAGMLFIVLCAVFVIFVIIALATKLVKAPIGRWSLLFIMAGGISNCIDRLLSGYVQDMFMPTFMDKLPIFNVADIFITVFCLIFILYVLFGGRSRDDDYDDEDEDEDDEELEDEDEESDVLEEEKSAEEKPERGLGLLFKREKPAEEETDDDEEEEEEEEEEDEAEEEEEEDDLPPARRPSRYDRAARAGKAPEKRRRSRDEEEDEDDEEEEEPVSRREAKEKAAPKKTSRRDRQAELDEKYARFKAERAAREQQWGAVSKEETPVVDPADPFAEWSDKSKAETPEAPVAPEKPAAVEAPAAPVEAAPKEDEMAFSLEDILAEFK